MNFRSTILTTILRATLFASCTTPNPAESEEHKSLIAEHEAMEEEHAEMLIKHAELMKKNQIANWSVLCSVGRQNREQKSGLLNY